MEHSHAQISDIIELWITCMRTTYFQSKQKFFKEKKAWQWEVHCLQLSAIYLWTSLKNFTRFSRRMTCFLVGARSGVNLNAVNERIRHVGVLFFRLLFSVVGMTDGLETNPGQLQKLADMLECIIESMKGVHK